MKRNLAITLATGVAIISATGLAYAKDVQVGKRIDALDNSLWDQSEWI